MICEIPSPPLPTHTFYLNIKLKQSTKKNLDCAPEYACMFLCSLVEPTLFGRYKKKIRWSHKNSSASREYRQRSKDTIFITIRTSRNRFIFVIQFLSFRQITTIYIGRGRCVGRHDNPYWYTKFENSNQVWRKKNSKTKCDCDFFKWITVKSIENNYFCT